MTIPEIAKEYNCNKSAIYQKFKRHKAELNGQYFVEDGVIHISSDAVELLLPEKILKADYAEKYNRASRRINIIERENSELTDKINNGNVKEVIIQIEPSGEYGNCSKQERCNLIAKEHIKILIEDRDYYEKMLDELNSKIAELQNQLSEKSRNRILSVFAKR